MQDPKTAIAASFVNARGLLRSSVARVAGHELLGPLGQLAADAAVREKPEAKLRARQLGYLTVFPQDLVLFKAKVGAFARKTTTEVLAAAPRTEVSSADLKHGVMAVLQVNFTDGSKWEFDIPAIDRAAASAVITALAQPPMPEVQFSPDRQFWWDGADWKPAANLSPDGRWWWDGAAWQPVRARTGS
jgi:hypothetical protein